MGKHHWKHIYAMLANDGRVKIGTSKDVSERVMSIEHSKEVKVIDVFKTEMCSNPFTVETICHDLFEGKRVFGEWFLIDFDEAVIGIKTLFEKYAKFEESNSDIAPILTVFFNKEEADKDEMLAMLVEIVSSQSSAIDQLIQSTMQLSQSAINISNMISEIKFTLTQNAKKNK